MHIVQFMTQSIHATAIHGEAKSFYRTLLKTAGDCHNQSADWFRNDIVFCDRVRITPTYSLFTIPYYFREAPLLGMTAFFWQLTV